MYVRIWKRAGDVLLAALGMALLSPLWAMVALAIKLDSRGPVLFWQKRIGKDKVPFYVAKFRTMRIDAPHSTPTHLLQDPTKYITRVGRLLRRTSLDEVPQLINILRGEMSLVGPRPALWNQYDLIAERDRYGVNALTPGLTGWAQVNGRDELPIPQKAKLDGEYARRASFRMDFRCVLMTLSRVATGAGYVEGQAPNGTSGH